MTRLLVSACLAGLAISGAPAMVMAAETAAAPAASSVWPALPKAATGSTAAIKTASVATATKPAGASIKGKIPLPIARPPEAEATDADAAEPAAAEVQADATPADAAVREAPADATADAPPETAEQKDAEARSREPSYMKTGHPQIDALVATHARVNNVPEALVHRVIVRESKYQKDLVGSCGCIGLMQIKLGTARGLGYTGDAQGLHDPNTNLTYGVKYLAGAYRAAHGDHDRAVHYFARGYYEVAKRQRLADAQPVTKLERAHAPLDITPRSAARAATRHAARAVAQAQPPVQ